MQNGSARLRVRRRSLGAGRFALLKRLRAAALGSSAVPLAGPAASEALYRDPNPEDGGARTRSAAKHPAWHLAQGERTGDLLVTAIPGGAFNEPNPLTGNHGGPQTRDNFFAVIGGGPLVRPQAIASAQDPLFDDTERNPGQSENVDVAPTVTRLLGTPAPAQSQGRFLAEAFDALAAARTGGGGGRGGRAVRGVGGLPLGQRAPARARAALRLRPPRHAGRGRRRLPVLDRPPHPRQPPDRALQRPPARVPLGRPARARRPAVRAAADRRPDGRADSRRIALVRRGGRFHRRPAFYRRASCGAIASFKLERPVFGGRSNRAVDVTYRLGATAGARLELLRGSRRVRRLAPTRIRRQGRAYRVRIASEGLRRGDYRVRLHDAEPREARPRRGLTARRL